MADITANPGRDRDQQRRNRRAWENFAHPETDQCRYCPHDRYDHIGKSQPPAALGEGMMTDDDEAQSPDYVLTRLFCLACADDLDTSQVVCYRHAAEDD